VEVLAAQTAGEAQRVHEKQRLLKEQAASLLRSSVDLERPAQAPADAARLSYATSALELFTASYTAPGATSQQRQQVEAAVQQLRSTEVAATKDATARQARASAQAAIGQMLSSELSAASQARTAFQ